MSDERPSDVLGALPRTRPHRRSDKRATRPEKGKPVAAVTPEALDAVQAAVAASDSAAAQAKATPPAAAKPPAAKKTKTKTDRPASAKTRAKPSAAATAKAKPATPGKAKAQPKAADAARTRLAELPARPAKSRRNDALSTAVQAAAELAEIGLTASARAIRRAVSRLPRP